MVYEYNPKVANLNKNVDYKKETKFIGYILPDGSVFQCKNHNITNAETFLKIYLEILDNDYSKRNWLLSETSDNALSNVILGKLQRMSRDEIHAFLKYMNEENIILSDLLVTFFGCHLVTRAYKEIITSEINHQCFYNYLLNGFKITLIGKTIYDAGKKQYKYIIPNNRNQYLYDEIEGIKNDIKEDEVELFYQGK